MRRTRPRSSAFRRSAWPLVLLAATAPAADGPSAKDILKKAVEAQGEMPKEVRDVTLAFYGEIRQEGQVNTVRRTYWYRSADRSFRMRTGSGAMEKMTSDRGVTGETGYWERTSAGDILELTKGNRDDREQIRAIEKERKEFERMLRMVLLARFDGDGWNVALAEANPVRLDKDFPHELRHTLGKREETSYHVLDMKREGEPDLRLYVHAGDFSVRKAIELDPNDPDGARFVYYFAAYASDPEAKLLVPQFLSIYNSTPLNEKDREEMLAAKGRPTVRINADLKDADLRPSGQ